MKIIWNLDWEKRFLFLKMFGLIRKIEWIEIWIEKNDLDFLKYLDLYGKIKLMEIWVEKNDLNFKT